MATKAPAKKKPTSDASDKKCQKALDGYVRGASVTKACKYAGISRDTWYRWLKERQGFAERVAAAYEQVTDRLEETAFEKACAGDSGLLQFMLKGRRKEVYGDRREISGPGGAPIQIAQKRVEDYESVIGRLAGGAPGPGPGEPVDPSQPD
jgi:hypothetical protein